MIKDIEQRLKDTIGEKRADHSIRVMEEAKKLAKIYDVDIESATMAGLLHDCGRFMDKSSLLKKADEFGIILDRIYTENVNLIHARLGVEIAKKEYGVEDCNILNAIRYHTTGREAMSILEKVVYMADYIEPFRSFKGIDEIRDLCYVEKDINRALVRAIDNTIMYILNSRSLIHEDTIKARNFLLFDM